MQASLKHAWIACYAVLATSSVYAAYPQQPIQLIHGFAAGGNADSVARVIAADMEKKLGTTVVVEPKTGAGGTIASAYVARAKPDGHTLILLTGGHTASAAVRKSLPYDPVNDFAMVSTVTRFPFVVAVSAKSPIKSLGELLESTQKSTTGATYSSVGVGSTQHLTGELLASTSKANFVHIPYRGGGAPVVAVMSGDVDVLIDTVTVASPQLAAGTLRALAVTSKDAWPLLPGVPSVHNSLPGFDVISWLGVAAPAGTPNDVLEHLNTTLKHTLNDPDIQTKLRAMGSEAWYSTPDDMRTMVSTTLDQWKRVVADSNIPMQ